ncbi:MAG TPA: hypothetical protein VFG01_10585 [Acidobacteriota bacterium]|nr:hypothetical protein [Acidobacteriota bacterium]
MKKTNNKFLSILVVFMVLFLSCSFSIKSKNSINQDEIEKFLKNAPITSIKKNLEMGRTNQWRVALKDGEKEITAIFKHVNRPRPALLPDCYKYEIAAFNLNKMLGLNIVPPTVERKINNQIGSLQLLIEKVMTERDRQIRNIQPKNPQEFNKDLDVIKIFEILVYDQCSDINDTLIQLDNWKVWRVDFSEAFSPSPDIPPECRIERCSENLYEKLLDINNSRLESELDPYLNKREINALLERKNIIIRTIINLIKQYGKEAVLF